MRMSKNGAVIPETGDRIVHEPGMKIDNRYAAVNWIYISPCGNVRLVGWQSIADHFGFSLPQVMKLHKMYGMPVVRAMGPKVWTTASALDTWLKEFSSAQRKLERQLDENQGLKPGDARASLWKRYKKQKIAEKRAGLRE